MSPEERTLDSNRRKLFGGGSQGINTALGGVLELLGHTRGWFFNEKIDGELKDDDGRAPSQALANPPEQWGPVCV